VRLLAWAGLFSCPHPGRLRLIVEEDQAKVTRPREAMMLSQNNRHAALARRLREIREELFGEEGVPLVAEALHLPARTWRDYEAGAAAKIPAAVLIRFIDLSGASLLWLLTGHGQPFLDSDQPGVLALPVAVRSDS
jgi:hypothetical protein